MNAKLVCPYLVNGNDCHDDKCQLMRNHGESVIRAWIAKRKTKIPCNRPSPCWSFEKDRCLYFHAPNEMKFKEKRRQLMQTALRSPSTIDLPMPMDPIAEEHISIEDVAEVSTYSVVNPSEIAIPGEPAYFTLPTMPLEVKNDEQNRPKEYVKHNSAFEPLITSIEVMKPTFDISSANLICSTGSLHRIYRYLEDSEDLDSDRLDMQWHSGTLFITRWADDPSRQTSAGYESGFERATCSFSGELQDHISHHRVLSYRLGGLHLVVRAESEAYFCECHKPSPGQTSTADSVAEGIGKLVVSNDGEATEQGLDGASSSLNVLKAGRDIPSSCLIMIRTGNQMYDRRPFEAQMYFSNRHRLYQISHTRGIFDPAGAKIEDVSDHLG